MGTPEELAAVFQKVDNFFLLKGGLLYKERMFSQTTL